MNKTDNGIKWPKICFKCLNQMFETCDKKQLANVVTGDENWIYYFEPVRKFSNKIWASKHSRRPIIAKQSLSARKVGQASDSMTALT